MPGSLVDLSSSRVDAHLTYCESKLIDDYILTTLRQKTGAGLDDVVYITGKASMEDALLVSTVLPMRGNSWLFVVDCSKFRGKAGAASIKTLYDGLAGKGTGTVWFKTTRYPDFKTVHEATKGRCNERYISYLTKSEMNCMLGQVELGTAARSFLVNNYANDIESPLRLKQYILDGHTVRNGTDVSNAIGVSVGSVQNVVLSIISRDKWSNATRMRTARTLMSMYSSLGGRRLRNSILKVLKDTRELKHLYLSGTVYKTIPGSSYPHLSKYNRGNYFERIKDIPLTRIDRIYIELERQNAWHSESNMLDWLYNVFVDR